MNLTQLRSFPAPPPAPPPHPPDCFPGGGASGFRAEAETRLNSRPCFVDEFCALDINGVDLTERSRVRIVENSSCNGETVASADTVQADGASATYTFGFHEGVVPFRLGAVYSVCWSADILGGASPTARALEDDATTLVERFDTEPLADFSAK